MALVVSSAGFAETVRVGLYENKPKIFSDENGKPSGIFVDILDEIAEREQWSLEYMPCEWVECLQTLEAGKIDLMPDVAYSQERDAKYDFHKIPVAESWSQVYSNPEVPIAGMPDLNGRRVAILKGSIQQKALRQAMKELGFDVTIVQAASYREAFELVEKGTADAAIANHFFGDYFYREYGLAKTTIIFNVTTLYFASAQGRGHELLESIDRHLSMWVKDPDSPYYKTMNRWKEKPPERFIPMYVLWIIAIVGGLFLLSSGMNYLLRRQVNARTEHLRLANEELEKHRGHLQELIEERTVELRKTNEMLTNEIAERKTAAEALRESEEKYRELVENANSIIMRMNKEGEVTFFNEYAQSFFEYPESEIIGKNVVGTIVPRVDSYGRNVEELLKDIAIEPGKYSYNENENMTRSGRKVWIAWTNKSICDDEGNHLETLCIGVDITDRKHMEEELDKYRDSLEDLVMERTSELSQAYESLRESEMRYRSLFEGAAEGIIVVDIETRNIKYANPAMLNILDYNEEEISKMAVLDIHPPEVSQQTAVEFEAVARDGKNVLISYPCLRRDGTVVYADIKAASTQIDGRDCCVAFFTDVSERKRAEEALALSEKFTTLAKLSMGLSHEIKNPVAIIDTHVDLIRENEDLMKDTEVVESLDTITGQTERIVSTLGNLSMLAKSTGFEPKRVNLTELVEMCLKMIRPRMNSQGIKLIHNLDSGNIVEITADSGRLIQLVTNLIFNALDSMPDGGELEVRLNETAGGGTVEIFVKDTGTGITEENLEKVLDPFFTTKPKGFGMGLSVCQRVVEEHSGEINISSAVNKGTEVRVVLPVEQS